MKKIHIVIAVTFCLALLAAPAPLRGADDDPTVVVCLGDSITFGVSTDPDAVAYPVQLQSILGTGYRVENCGFSGQTSAYLLARFPGCVKPKKPDWLVVLAGVNDINIWADSLENVDYAIYGPDHVIERLRQIGEDADALGAATIYMTVWPDEDFDDTKLKAIEKVNSWILQSAAAEVPGAVAIDMAGQLLAKAGPEKHLVDPKYHDGTHLHLTQLGYAKVAEAVAETLKKHDADE